MVESEAYCLPLASVDFMRTKSGDCTVRIYVYGVLSFIGLKCIDIIVTYLYDPVFIFIAFDLFVDKVFYHVCHRAHLIIGDPFDLEMRNRIESQCESYI